LLTSETSNNEGVHGFKFNKENAWTSLNYGQIDSQIASMGLGKTFR